jgi:uncharacterized membrane protein (UPF0127 family)
VKTLRNLTRGTLVAARVEEATRPLSRLKGLLGRAELGAGEALLIAPCTSIHTFFMRFPIDVIFLDGDGRALRALEQLNPWRATRIYPRAACAIELPAGALRRSATREGDVLRLDFSGVSGQPAAV